jgi:lysophospholipase L1-like esterase
VAGRLGNDYSWYTITNDSVNGRVIAGAMDVVSGLSEKNRHDLIVFQIGSNDMLGGTSAAQTVARQKQLIEATRPYTDNIVILTSGNLGAAPIHVTSPEEFIRFTGVMRTYDELMYELVLQYDNVAFVPLFDEPENDPFIVNPQTYISIDGLHPTSAGYAKWYQKAKPYFDAVLESQ